ncbi:MAG TPA: hypothetical protein PK360_06395 [bacterium]|nr:hypothetical protein [bacterium]
MLKKRFLRDKVLDEMLSEIRRISENVPETRFPSLVFSKSLLSLSELYESNKVVLQRLEGILDQLRKNPSGNEEIIDEVVEAAVHVQQGLMSVHNALTQDIRGILDGIQDLREILGLAEREKSGI